MRLTRAIIKLSFIRLFIHSLLLVVPTLNHLFIYCCLIHLLINSPLIRAFILPFTHFFDYLFLNLLVYKFITNSITNQ